MGGAEAHASAISSLPASGVCSEAQLTAINAALGRMIASVPESTTMGVYDAVGKLMDPTVPAYLMATVKEPDARAAYNALIDFTQVVKANPISPSTPASSVSGSAASSISAAADKLSAAASLKEAANAHVKAIGGMDGRGVLSESDFAAINAGLGKAIASVPTTKVMDVYNAVAKVIGNSGVPNKLFSTVNPNDAQAAYSALLEFKDVVKAAQR